MSSRNMSAQQVAQQDARTASKTKTALIVSARMAALKGREMLRVRTATMVVDGSSKLGIVDTGRYYRSWTVKRIPVGFALYNSAPYADVIELGRRPGSRPPPSKAILGWVLRNASMLGLQKETKVVTKRRNFFGTTRGKVVDVVNSRAKGLAFIIARAIGRRGIKGKRVMLDILHQLTEEFVRMGGKVALHLIEGA